MSCLFLTEASGELRALKCRTNRFWSATRKMQVRPKSLSKVFHFRGFHLGNRMEPTWLQMRQLQACLDLGKKGPAFAGPSLGRKHMKKHVSRPSTTETVSWLGQNFLFLVVSGKPPQRANWPLRAMKSIFFFVVVFQLTKTIPKCLSKIRILKFPKMFTKLKHGNRRCDAVFFMWKDFFQRWLNRLEY